MNTVLLFAIGILMGSIGAICMKRGANDLPDFEVTLAYAYTFIGNPYIMSGFLLYAIPAVIWAYLLSLYPVSFVQPILSMTYVLTPVLAMFFLSEPVPAIRWLGIAVIVLGVVLVSRS